MPLSSWVRVPFLPSTLTRSASSAAVSFRFGEVLFHLLPQFPQSICHCHDRVPPLSFHQNGMGMVSSCMLFPSRSGMSDSPYTGTPRSRSSWANAPSPSRQSAGKAAVVDHALPAGRAALLEHRALRVEKVQQPQGLLPRPGGISAVTSRPSRLTTLPPCRSLGARGVGELHAPAAPGRQGSAGIAQGQLSCTPGWGLLPPS